MATHCPHCHMTNCPGREGSPHYANEDFDRCQAHTKIAHIRMMKAAPDLLAALQYIVNWNPDNWDAELARDQARAAIFD